MSLLQSVTFGDIVCRNRAVIAPLTRCRATEAGVPTPLMAEYYSQRASSGLIITEASSVSPTAIAFYRAGCLFNEAQAAGWRTVVDAVHAKGGKIICQLFHPGRAAHPENNDGRTPVSATATQVTSNPYRHVFFRPELRQKVIDAKAAEEAAKASGSPMPAQSSAELVAYGTPRALTDDEIPAIVEQFKNAAVLARKAGFDGVEIHGANGYLIDQFLRCHVDESEIEAQKATGSPAPDASAASPVASTEGANANKDVYASNWTQKAPAAAAASDKPIAGRPATSRYGGASLENRARLLLEVVDATAQAFSDIGGTSGYGSVGVRISPLNSFQSMKDRDIAGTVRYVAAALEQRKCAFLHVMRSDFFGVQVKENPGLDVVAVAKSASPTVPIVTNMGYTLAEADKTIAEGRADAVAFGTLWIANPDLVERAEKAVEAGAGLEGAQLNAANPNTFYSNDAAGYVDYPTLATSSL